MEKIVCIILALTPVLGFTQKSGLIFQSGFESDTRITEQNEKSAKITGTDKSLPLLSDWNNDLEGHLNIGYFNFQYQGGNSSQRLAEIVTDPVDPSNKVMKFWIKEPNVNPKKGRVQANLYNNTDLKKLGYTIRLYLPSDFNEIKKAPFKVDWLTIMEFWNNANWREEDYKFRISVNLQKRGEKTDSLRIAVKGQVYDLVNSKWKKPYLWEFKNTTFVVPVGKWMTIDVHFEEGDANTGRLIISITPDGEPKTKVFDVTNFTHHPDDPSPDGLSHLNPFKLYTSDDLINYVTKSGKLLSVYWDDFKLSVNYDQ